MHPSGSERYAPRSPGATTSSTRRRRTSSRGCRSSRAASRSPLPRRCAAPTSTGSAPSSTSSLLKPIGDDRFLMLETLREYAGGEAGESAGRDELLSRHAAYFRELAEQAYLHRFAAEAEWSARSSRPTTTTCAQRSTGCSRTIPTPPPSRGCARLVWLSRGLVREGAGRLSDASPLPALLAPFARVRARRTAR